MKKPDTDSELEAKERVNELSEDEEVGTSWSELEKDLKREAEKKAPTIELKEAARQEAWVRHVTKRQKMQ